MVAGYSGTPLARKLGIKPGSRVLLVRPPDGFEDELVPLPDDVSITSQPAGELDVIVTFCRMLSELEASLAELLPRIHPNGGLWIAWPKKSSDIITDVTEHVVRELGLATGLVDNKVAAVTEIWSGLRFVVRVENRPKKR